MGAILVSLYPIAPGHLHYPGAAYAKTIFC